MKFKVGDIIKGITDEKYSITNTSMYKAEVISTNGNEMTIKILKHKNSFAQEEEYSVKNSDKFFKLIEEHFTKSDLKNGDIVTYRSGDKRTVVAGNLINSSGYISKKLNQYTNELKDTVAGKNLDIIKVERPAKYETVFESKEEILDKTEKEYLANVIRPFRHEIKTIEKTTKIGDSSLCYLNILLKNNDMANLPDFKKNSMYKGMEVNKEYTLKELGL